MDKSVLQELCKEEEELVERLRLLREFKDKFFTSFIKENDLTVSKPVTEAKPEIRKTVSKKVTKRGKKTTGAKRITVAQKVLTALGELKRGKSKDVALKLIELYPADYKSAAKATGDARYQMSDLMKLGKIEIDEPGLGSSGAYYKIKQNETADNII